MARPTRTVWRTTREVRIVEYKLQQMQNADGSWYDDEDSLEEEDYNIIDAEDVSGTAYAHVVEGTDPVTGAEYYRTSTEAMPDDEWVLKSAPRGCGSCGAELDADCGKSIGCEKCNREFCSAECVDNHLEEEPAHKRGAPFVWVPNAGKE